MVVFKFFSIKNPATLGLKKMYNNIWFIFLPLHFNEFQTKFCDKEKSWLKNHVEYLSLHFLIHPIQRKRINLDRLLKSFFSIYSTQHNRFDWKKLRKYSLLFHTNLYRKTLFGSELRLICGIFERNLVAWNFNKYILFMP